MNEVKVSIITPCFNSEKTIAKTMTSVIGQNYKNIEYIIVDGASTDRTLDIIDEYKDKFTFEFKLVSEKDNGIYDAMNKGIRMSTGDLIGIVNSDDYYEPDAIESIVSAYTGAEYEIIYGMQRIIDENDNEKSVVFYNHNFIEEQIINHPTCFITRRIYAEFGTYSTDYRSSADYAFLLGLFDTKKIVFTPIYRIISNFRTGGMSASMTGFRETLKLKLERGTISKKRYYYLLIKSHLHELFR